MKFPSFLILVLTIGLIQVSFAQVIEWSEVVAVEDLPSLPVNEEHIISSSYVDIDASKLEKIPQGKAAKKYGANYILDYAFLHTALPTTFPYTIIDTISTQRQVDVDGTSNWKFEVIFSNGQGKQFNAIYVVFENFEVGFLQVEEGHYKFGQYFPAVDNELPYILSYSDDFKRVYDTDTESFIVQHDLSVVMS